MSFTPSVLVNCAGAFKLSSFPLDSKSRVSRHVQHLTTARRVRIRAKQNTEHDDPDSHTKIPQMSRRDMLQLINGGLGVATLVLLVKMKEQFRLLSPKSVLSTFGFTNLPFRTAVPAAAAAGMHSSEDVKMAMDYLRSLESYPFRPCPDLPSNSDWINSRPLSLKKELAGKIVLVDFFTYCCINCQHVLPKLRNLEQKYGEDGSGGVVVVGVHSAKFRAERDTVNVAAAVERYGVQHPVVNDENMQLWSALGISSWPSLALIGPKGNVLAIWSGENQENDIDNIITAAKEYYADIIDHRPLPPAPKRSAIFGQLANSPFRYPGKIAISANPGRLWVSDSGNNRVLQLDIKTGRILRVFGNGEPGLVDSADGSTAQFHTPQGITEHSGKLFVADTECHAVRAIDLQTGAVTTVGGNGEQGFDYKGGKIGKAQALSSPWDVEVSGDDLYVAMAGTHQIWRLSLLSKGPNSIVGNAWQVFSGSGRELEKNSTDGRVAAWAQPSHLSMSNSRGLMFVADSESSSVRAISITEERNPTRTLAGGDGLLAENLFAFGDEEGRGARARFQHPLAVCFDESTNRIFVADSYNHRIKVVDNTSLAKNFCGSGKPGFKDGSAKEAMFWEPAGLALSSDGSKLYVSDTNNFAIRVVDTQTGKVTTMKINSDAPVPTSTAVKPLIPIRRRAVRIACDAVKPTATLRVSIALPDKSHFTPGTTSRFQVNRRRGKSSDDILEVLTSGNLSPSKGMGTFAVDLTKYGTLSTDDIIEIESVTYYCTDTDDVCRVESDIFSITLAQDASDSSSITQTIVPRQIMTMGKPA